MKKIIIITLSLYFIVSNIFAGCMKSEIKQLDAKLSTTDLSDAKKAEVKKLRDIVVANEHKNSELAFESYEKAVSLLN
ncbi:MAG: hypothetical protein CML36_02080 [Rhodobacteraceae bacterium]|nr:hypothetical protein [Paracoccaceae bacterium]OUU62508.1 MAG: hypothetical protein CBC22_04270 [Alphaproteobacteria bacterium TMED62]|tara:strand:- start:1281 stop:1514 length:234 start_codon:yes stop_codon:yes gene_type:complete